MSGPKTSRYTLTPEQRRILEEQRKIERRKAVASEKIKKAQKKLLAIGGMFEREKQIAAELTAKSGSDNEVSALIAELEELTAPTQSVVTSTDYNSVESLEASADTLGASLEKAEKIAEKISYFSEANEITLKERLYDDIDNAFEMSFDPMPEEDILKHMRCGAELWLKTILKKGHLPKNLSDKINDALARLGSIENKVFAKNYISITVGMLIDEAELFIKEYEEYRKEFEELSAEYAGLCELYGYTAQEYTCSREAVETLRAEIRRIKEDIAEDDEQAYISECLDEVMEEMGYTVLGNREVVKRNGKHFRNELYSYEEGTAVNITYSSDGKIAMELGGIDTSDRLPTEQETKKLCASMEHFCEDFHEIESRLLEKGILPAGRISLLPPDAEYAQIINTTDYSMNTEAERINVRKQKRFTAKRKTMRRS